MFYNLLKEIPTAKPQCQCLVYSVTSTSSHISNFSYCISIAVNEKILNTMTKVVVICKHAEKQNECPPAPPSPSSFAILHLSSTSLLNVKNGNFCKHAEKQNTNPPGRSCIYNLLDVINGNFYKHAEMQNANVLPPSLNLASIICLKRYLAKKWQFHLAIIIYKGWQFHLLLLMSP